MAYDTARQSEVTQIAQAEAALKDAQQTLDALQATRARSDLAAGQGIGDAGAIQPDRSATGRHGRPAWHRPRRRSHRHRRAWIALTATGPDTDIAAAQATLIQAQVAVDTAQSNLAQATLTAPFDGVVSAVSVVANSAISSATRLL